MLLNPLFISNASTGNTVDGAKENKFTNSNYLFANIINVNKDKLTLAEPNIELEEKTKALFSGLKSSNLLLNKKSEPNSNEFVADDLNLTSFLKNILEQINVGSSDKKSANVNELAVTEKVKKIIELLQNGENISIPISNNGKTAFVEIQSLDKNLASKNEPKGIKLAKTDANEIKLTETDIKKVISDISLSLKEVLSSDSFNMSDKKVQAIVKKIENDLSKLVPQKDETFQPQKNVLASLIGGIEKELQLNGNESNELKKVIVTQFAKLINEKTSSVNATNANSEVEFVPLEEVVKKLELSENEEELIKSLNVAVVNPVELKEKIESLLQKSDNFEELKPILSKLNNLIKLNSSQPKEIISIATKQSSLPEIAKELKLTPKEETIVKNVVSEKGKISLLELSKEVKVESTKFSSTPEVKSLFTKLESYLGKPSEFKDELSKPSETKSELTVEKSSLPEIAKELKLTPKEEAIVKNVVSEKGKISLSELSKELKVESTKLNSTSEVKSLFAKLESFLSKPSEFKDELSKTSETKSELIVEKSSLPELAKELKLTPKEEAIVKNVVSEKGKISLSELSKEVKVETTKFSSAPEEKSLFAKLESFLSKPSEFKDELSKASEIKSELTVEKSALPEIAKELKLTPKEEAIVKSTISEKGKISLLELSKEVKVESTKFSSVPEVKSLFTKLENYLSKPSEFKDELSKASEIKSEFSKPNETKSDLTVEKSSLPEIAKELKLTPKETKLVSELNVEKIDLDELKSVIKSKIENNPNNKLLKTLSQKLELVDSSSKSEIAKTGASESKPNLVTKELVANETKQTNKIKPTLKPENVSDVEKVEDKNTKQSYLLTIKSEKSAESVPFEKLAKVETKTPELLKKSIYTSKESIELTKLKIVPINEEVGKKNEIKSVDDDFKRLSFKKVSTEQKVINVNDNLKKSYSESDNSSKNNGTFGQSNVITSDLNKTEFSDKNFAKHVAENSNEEIAKTEISKKESNTEVKATEVKNSETIMPKTAFVEHQIRNNDLRVIPKATFKQLDLKNIKEEISSLIQKGEKKSVEFQLNPENLGKMNIKLEVTNKMVSASIKVENETTQQAVQNSLEGLKNSLNQQGLQLSSLNVSLADADEKNNRYFKQKKKNNSGLNVKVNGFDDKFAHKNLGYNNYDFIA